MRNILSTTWGASVLSAIFGAMLIALVGIVAGAPAHIIIFSAVLFGALLIIIVQLGVVISILYQSRGTASDAESTFSVGATTMREIESPEGQQELKKMSFISLLTVAIVQELHQSLFERVRPIWAFEFLGVGSDAFLPRDYGKLNRYLEWMLMIALFVFTIIAALLGAAFVNSFASPRGVTAATLVCVLPAFLFGAVLAFAVGLFFTSVVRRLFILYAQRADEGKIV